MVIDLSRRGAARPSESSDGPRLLPTTLALAPAEIGAAWPPVTHPEDEATQPSRRWRRLLSSRSAVIGGVILLAYMLLALVGSSIAPYSPLEFHYSDTLKGPSITYWLGTDQYGRDIFSRVLAGARSIVLIAFGATALGVLGGTLIGLTAGYYGGKTDEAIMRVADGVMSFPSLLLALLVLTTLGPSVGNIIVAVAITFIPRVARIIRSVALDLRTQPFVLAAQARGERAPYIITRELLPNTVSAILVESSIRVGYAILIGASLGFLGLGVQPPTPDWGLMIYEGRSMIQIAPWLVIGPAIAISILVIAANLFADGISRVLDSSERIEDAA
jgi:peptide/nickel transport system permease protein